MAQVKIEDIIDHLDTEIRKALSATIKHHFPDLQFNDREIFRTFRRNVGRKCSTWETVSDDLVEKDI